MRVIKNFFAIVWLIGVLVFWMKLPSYLGPKIGDSMAYSIGILAVFAWTAIFIYFGNKKSKKTQ